MHSSADVLLGGSLGFCGCRTTAGSGLMSSGFMAGTQRTRGMTVASTFPSFACTLSAAGTFGSGKSG